jgi:tetratricopeptide (TPR) repeat protein
MRARLLLVLLWLALPTVVSAQEDLARARFLEGRAAYERGEYARAYVDWQESYEISQRPELLYNVGLAAQKMGNARAALEAFEGYLTWGRGEREAEVRGRMEALRDMQARQAAPAKAEPAAAPTPAAVAVAAQLPEPVRAPAPAAREAPKRSSRGWWIAAGVVLAAAAIAVGVAVPLAQRDSKPENVPEPNTGLTISALRWAP